MSIDRQNDLLAALALFTKYHGNEVIAFSDIGDLVNPCGVIWYAADDGTHGLGTVTYGTTVAAVRGYRRRQLMDRFSRMHPEGSMTIDANAESDKLLTPWAELAAALCFVLLGKDPGTSGMSAVAFDLRKDALKTAFWDEIKRRNH